MKRLSLLAFTLITACGQSSRDSSEAAPVGPFNNRDAKAVPQLTSCYEGDEWTCAVEAAIVAKTNIKRASLAPLQQSFETSFVARAHSLDMLARNSLDHNGFADEREKVLQAEFPGLNFFFTAENVAFMSNSKTEADDVAQALVDLWWGSDGHRKNMLGKHTWLGVGVARSKDRVYATQLFH